MLNILAINITQKIQLFKNQLKELIEENNKSFTGLGAIAIQGSAILKS